MTAKITVEKTSTQTIRMTLVVNIQFSGNLDIFPRGEDAEGTAACGGSGTAPAAGGNGHGHELLTVEQTAEILNISRDKIYYLIRAGQLRSIKIGKLRRISRAWITEFVEDTAARRHAG